MYYCTTKIETMHYTAHDRKGRFYNTLFAVRVKIEAIQCIGVVIMYIYNTLCICLLFTYDSIFCMCAAKYLVFLRFFAVAVTVYMRLIHFEKLVIVFGRFYSYQKVHDPFKEKSRPGIFHSHLLNGSSHKLVPKTL